MGISFDPTKPLKDLWNKTRKEMEKLANSLKDGIKNTAKSAVKSVTKRGDEVRGALRRFGNEVEDQIKSVGNDVEDAVEDVAHNAEDQLKKTFNQLEDELEDAAKKAFEFAKEEATEAAQAAMKEISKGALNKAVDTIQIVAPSSIDLKLGPIGLSIGDLTNRVDTLQKWASDPPSGRNDIRAIIEEIAPTSVSIEVSISLAFLLVQSDSLEFGVTTTYETADFLNKMDEILDNFGINI